MTDHALSAAAPVLAVDTSGAITVGVVRDAALLAGRHVEEDRRHAELLAPLVKAVLAEAGLRPNDLAAVVAGTGPAPFTGLRAGLVTARMLAVAIGVPVLGVSSLDVLAAQAFADPGLAGSLDGDPPPEVLVVTDARRREVYAARYVAAAGGAGTGEPTCVWGPAVVTPGALAADIGAAVAVGPGTRRHPDVLGPERGPMVVDAVHLVRLGLDRAERGVEQPTEPLYLRRPDVTPAPGRKRVTG